MKRLITILLSITLFISCSNDLELRMKELEDTVAELKVELSKKLDTNGDIVVNSITVSDGGSIKTLNKDGKTTSTLGSSKNGNAAFLLKRGNGDNIIIVSVDPSNDKSHLSLFDKQKPTISLRDGHLKTFNDDGKLVTYLGKSSKESGYLRTYNSHGTSTSFLGTNKNEDGLIILYDRFGKDGYARKGKLF